jgi:hypothetical protein
MQSKVTKARTSMEDISTFQRRFHLMGWDSGAEPDVAVYFQ